VAEEDAVARVRFGPFEVDLASGEIRRDGVLVPLQELPFKLLAALVERPGTVITRADLTARLWGGETFVDAAAGLNTAVAKLRDALGDNAERPTYVETIPKRGYRFIAPVTPVAQGSVAQGFGAAKPVARGFSPARPKPLIWTAAAVLTFAAILFAAFQLRADRPRTRVAVVLFDNETGRPELARLAQNLTDATVTELSADSRLAVVGNAAVLRTERPFRDIAKIRDAVSADFIVIGQVQSLDSRTIVRTHLIRAVDESHLKVNVSTLTPAGEAPLQDEVGRGVRTALAHALGR
jgi:DNA-binding winged helix-turn-helix (wHTH) protein/TolB-like protein